MNIWLNYVKLPSTLDINFSIKIMCFSASWHDDDARECGKTKKQFSVILIYNSHHRGEKQIHGVRKSSKEKMKISKNDKKQRIFRFPYCHVSSRGFLFCEMLLWFLDMLSLFFIVLSNGADEDEISKTHFGRSRLTVRSCMKNWMDLLAKWKLCVWSWPDDDTIIC